MVALSRSLSSTLLLVAALASVGSCTRDRHRPRAVIAADARVGSATRTVTDPVSPPLQDAGPTVTPSLEAAVSAVRRGDFRAARTVLDGLAPAVRDTREARYLRARTSLELDDPASAIPALDGLDREIPALRVEIARLHASALARAGRTAEARSRYERIAQEGGGDRDRAQAALLAFSAGDRAAAATVMRRWGEHPPPGIARPRAWKSAAECLESVNDRDGAVAMWRRLAVREPDTTAATAALAALQRLTVQLSLDETLDRAAELVERARYTEALVLLEALPEGRGARDSRRLHLLGRAAFGARNRYADAHRWLTTASQRTENTDRDEDAFLAARALSRTDRDDDAVRAYDEVARTVRGRWGDEAAYRAAWLEARHVRVASATARLQSFLRSRPEALPRLRVEAAWQVGWTLYSAGRFTEAVAPLEQSGTMATHHLERGRGRYWAAMARARSADSTGAVRGWTELIEHRPLTWYALLSEARLRERGRPLPALAAPPERRPALPVRMSERVSWLRAMGFDREAATALAAEESGATAGLPRERADESLALAMLELGEARRAFQLSSRHAEHLDPLPTPETRWVWDCGFPRPHAASVEAAEDTGGMPRHYLFAIMRQESGFDPREISSARAIGLLQMIPPTTRRVARELGIAFDEDDLLRPEYNIRVGGHYIGRLFRQYRGVLPRAAGSFNAGPGAMGRWIRENGTEPLDVFVERIPFDETRTYVRRVVQNLARYRYLNGTTEAERTLTLPLDGNAGIDPLVDY